MKAAYNSLPLIFEANEGQAPGAVRYLARGAGYTLYLTNAGAVLALGRAPGGGAREAAIRMELLGAGPRGAATGAARLPGVANYFIGGDPRTWRTHIATYAQVLYPNVYPGVDLVFYGRAGQLEYDFRVHPGASPSAIRLAFGGAQGVQLTPSGDLALRLAKGEVRFHAPAAYQLDESGGRHFVTAGFRMERRGAAPARQASVAAFRLGDYDRSRALVIDPTLSFATYLGGSGADSAAGVAVDASGGVYLAGQTSSADFPVAGPFQASNGGGTDAFVTKISADGKTELYSTYLGGSGTDAGTAIAVDSAGEAFVTGYTNSTSAEPFPTTSGSRQTANAGGYDAFVTKLDSTGAALVYSAYLGGTGDDYGYGIAVDSNGNAYVAGSTTSVDFPATKSAYQTKNGGGVDAFMDEIPAAGTAPSLYATYLGGTGDDVAYGVALDASNNVYVTGQTASASFPVSASPFQATSGGATDAFVAELTPSASGAGSLAFSSYLGGGGDDTGYGIAVDSAGNAYVAGSTASTNFPVTGGVVQAANGGGKDAFVAEVAAGGASLAYATYLGGTGDDAAYAVALDGAADAFVAGNTTSTNFPTASALQASCSSALNSGCDDAFAAEVPPGAASLNYSTFLGGDSHDAAAAIAVDTAGNAYVAGATNSTDFPATAGAFQTACGSGTSCGNAFLLEIGAASASVQALPSILPFGVQTIGLPSAPQNVTVTNSSGSTVTFTGIAASSGFAVDAANTTCLVTSPLENNASCVVAVTFTPNVSGLQTGTLTLTDSAPGSPQVVSLSGTGVTSVVTLEPDVVTFANQFVGTSSTPQALTLVNSGSTTLTISGIALTSGSPFSETNNCGSSLAAGQSCAIDVTFSPTTTGTASATLTVSDSASGSPQTASLSGTGVSPAVSLSAATLNFGTQTVGSVSPTPQAVTLTNTGNAALSITGIAIGGTDAGDFSLTAQSPCGASVAPGGTCSIQVNFTPGSSGARSATLSISDNASGSPQTVALSGTGSDFKLSASPPSATVHQGGSTSYTLTVTPLSGFTGTVSLACNGAPGDGSCNLSLPSATFTANSSPVSVTVNVGTTAPGAAPGRPRTTPPGRPRTVPVLLGLLLAALLALRLARGWRWRAATLAAAALLIAVLAASCGNTVKTRPASGTPFGTYTLTLTGSSSNLGHSTSVTLIVN